MGTQYIQNTVFDMIPFSNKILGYDVKYYSVKDKYGSEKRCKQYCISIRDTIKNSDESIIAGPFYICNEDDAVLSSDFITELELTIINAIESEEKLTQKVLRPKLAEKVIERFNDGDTPQIEKEAIKTAVERGKYFNGVIDIL